MAKLAFLFLLLLNGFFLMNFYLWEKDLPVSVSRFWEYRSDILAQFTGQGSIERDKLCKFTAQPARAAALPFDIAVQNLIVGNKIIDWPTEPVDLATGDLVQVRDGQYRVQCDSVVIEHMSGNQNPSFNLLQKRTDSTWRMRLNGNKKITIGKEPLELVFPAWVIRVQSRDGGAATLQVRFNDAERIPELLFASGDLIVTGIRTRVTHLKQTAPVVRLIGGLAAAEFSVLDRSGSFQFLPRQSFDLLDSGNIRNARDYTGELMIADQ